MNSRLILSRLTDRRAEPYLTAAAAAVIGIALAQFCWHLSSRLFYHGIIPAKNPFMLFEGIVMGTVSWQFLLGFSLTRFLWHKRQIEWWMFALICLPIPIFFARSLSGVSTEALLVLGSVAMSWAAPPAAPASRGSAGMR